MEIIQDLLTAAGPVVGAFIKWKAFVLFISVVSGVVNLGAWILETADVIEKLRAPILTKNGKRVPAKLEMALIFGGLFFSVIGMIAIGSQQILVGSVMILFGALLLVFVAKKVAHVAMALIWLVADVLTVTLVRFFIFGQGQSEVMAAAMGIISILASVVITLFRNGTLTVTEGHYKWKSQPGLGAAAKNTSYVWNGVKTLMQ